MNKKEAVPPSNSYSRIFVLPSIFTAGNLFFGYLAIIQCIQAKYGTDSDITSTVYYTQAVWYILLAFICDVLDGRIARSGGKESLFGKEFDSIADIVSFGVAPSLMVFFLILSPTEGYPFFIQVGWIIGFIYLLCCGVRLSRFNVITHPLVPNDRPTNAKSFIGLPVPAAAAFIASLVLIINHFHLPSIVWLCMPGLMLLIAGLMVSNIPYPSFKEFNSSTQIRARVFLALTVLAVILFLFKEIALAFTFLGYIFYGLFRYLGKKVRRKSK